MRYIEILNHLKSVNPNVRFLLENVKMKQEYQDIISEHLGVKPIEINSALVSAQNRKRLYWTNVPNVTQPEDKGILLKDVIHEFCGDIIDYKKYCLDEKNLLHCSRKFGSKAPDLTGKDKSNTITAAMGMGGGNVPFMFHELEQYIVPFEKTLQILDRETETGKIKFVRQDDQGKRIYVVHNQEVCVSENSSDAMGEKDCCLFGCITPERINKRQNGQRFNDGKKFYTLTAIDRHGILVGGYIRKLTPVECERLQTMDDGYTDGVSNSARYKALGNGWTVDVISHIFKGLINNDD